MISRYIIKPIEVLVSKCRYEKILHDFASAVTLTVNYNDCNQYNYKLMVHQHFVGKLVELAVYLSFIERYIKCTKPDFNIYEGENKNWNSDLIVDNKYKLSIKGQDLSSAKKFGLSWTFQSINGGRKDKSLSKREEIIVPGLYHNNDDANFKVIVFPPISMDKAIMKDPIKNNLIGKKKVLYAKDNYPELNSWLSEFNIDLRKLEKVYGRDKYGNLCFIEKTI